jgi:hypothetical protein
MLLKRFMTTFLRVQTREPDKTTLKFVLIDEAETDLWLYSSEFDVEANAWIVRLRSAHEV